MQSARCAVCGVTTCHFYSVMDYERWIANMGDDPLFYLCAPCDVSECMPSSFATYVYRNPAFGAQGFRFVIKNI